MGRSAIEGFIYVGRHGVDLGIQFLLNLDHRLLVSFSDEVDGESDLSEPARPADPVKVDAAFGGEVEVDDDVDSLHVDAPGDEVGTNKGLVLPPPEPLETLDPLIRFHVRMQILILVLLFIELPR